MNFGTLSHHADDKVISNIRERIQKQQRLRNQNQQSSINDNTTNTFHNNNLTHSINNKKSEDNLMPKNINIKKTVHQRPLDQYRPALTELTNTNIDNRNNSNNSTRSLRNNNNVQAKIYNNQENVRISSNNSDQQTMLDYDYKMATEAQDDSVIYQNQTVNSQKHVKNNESTSSLSAGTYNTSRSELQHLKLETTPEDRRILQLAFQEQNNLFSNIEDPDKFDVTLCTEYQPEIFNHMKMLEEKFAPLENFIMYQPHLTWKHRSIVLNWLVYTHDKLKLLPETLYLCVNLFDRLLSLVEVTKEKLHLVAATCIFVASKYEEINHVSTSDLKTLLNNEYEDHHFYLAETFVLQSLKFDIGFPGPMSFLTRISKSDNYQYDRRTLAKYLLETTIMDPKFSTAQPSWLAAGAYYLSMVIFENLEDYNRFQNDDNFEENVDGNNENATIWTSKHIYYSGYTERQIAVVASTIAHNCRNWERSHEAIYQKYRSKKYKKCSLAVDEWLRILEEQRVQEMEGDLA
ncbi:hypothetical protein QEN19_001545 [Hanseniaspora menglaensis]